MDLETRDTNGTMTTGGCIPLAGSRVAVPVGRHPAKPLPQLSFVFMIKRSENR
jgi:hypothetical protein